jgi:heat shock protein HslJ
MMIRVAGVASCVFLLAAGCATGGPGHGAGQGPDGQLDGRTFLSTAVTESGVPRPLVEGSRIRIAFNKGQVHADAGCNQLSGPYTVDGSALVVNELAMTEMACQPSERMDQDTWLGALLSSRPTINVRGDTLVIANNTSEVTMVDREVADPDRALVGPRWRVESLIAGDAVSSTPGDAEAHVTFSADGRVTGSTGCNQFGGVYAATAGSITFSQIFTTKKACFGGANLLESAVTVLFDGRPVPYRIDADQMTLTYANGTGGLQLRAVA